MNRKKIINVPKIKQLENYCGPASVSMVFAYYGLCLSQEQIAEEITSLIKMPLHSKQPACEFGLDCLDIVRYCLKKGFAVEYHQDASIDELINLVSEDIPPIVSTDYVSNREYGHFSVIKGYDLDNKLLFYNDPADLRRSKLDFELFKEIWLLKISDGKSGLQNEVITIRPGSRAAISKSFRFQNTKDKGQAQKGAV